MLQHLILALSVFFLLSVSVHSQSTPILTFRDSEYQYFGDDNIKTWEEAENTCALFGGNLVSLMDQQELEFVSSMTNHQIWIGLNDRLLEGQWMWTYPASRVEFTNWAPDQPSSTNNHDCVIMNRPSSDGDAPGIWSSFYCSTKNAFVCKRLINSCPWGSAVVGAPQPAIEIEFESDSLSIQVEVPQKHNYNATFYIGFEPLSLNVTLEEKCGENSTNIIDMGVWTEKSHRCSSVFSLNMPLEAFINMTGAAVIPEIDSDIIRIEKNLYVSYFDHDATGREIECAVSNFVSKITTRTVLVAEGTMAFRADNVQLVNRPSFSALSLNGEGKLLIDITLESNDEESYLKNFAVVSHSKGLGFSVSLEHEDCANPPANTLSCSYRLNIVSDSPSDDFSGLLTLSFDFVWPTGNRTQETMDILLSYVTLEQSNNLENDIETIVSLVDGGTFDPISTFTPFENATILVKTNPPMNIPGAKFQFDDVFFCCTKGRSLLPAFNPAKGHLGCTVRNNAVMSFWTQLVVGGEFNSDMFVEPVFLGPLVRDKIALSFSPIQLYGSDKVCYIHARTTLILDETEDKHVDPSGPSSTKFISPRKNAHAFTSNSFQAVTLQSCSKESSRETCEQYGQYCQWDNNLSICAMRDYSAASTTEVSVAITFLLMVLTFLF